MRVLLVGAGGHGQVVADALLASRAAGHDLDLVGFVDDDHRSVDRLVLGYRVLGGCTDLERVPHDAVIVSIGDNATRCRVFTGLDGAVRWAMARHPSAVIAADVKPGDGSMILAGAIVNTGSQIGRNVILNTGCSVDHHCRIGDHVHIAPGARLGGAVTVHQAALIGIGATILPGIEIGVGAVIGAGAVVLRPVPEGATAYGNPARWR